MGTTPIDTHGSKVLVLLEQLRQFRSVEFSTPTGCQMVPLELLDEAIITIAMNALNNEEYRRFHEAWFTRFKRVK